MGPRTKSVKYGWRLRPWDRASRLHRTATADILPPMMTLRLFALFGAGLVLAACSNPDTPRWGSGPTQWGHPKMSAKEQSADEAECHYRANYQTEREVQAEGPFANEQRDVRLQQMFDRHDQAQRTRQIYDNCLRDKGYVPVVPEK